MLKQAKAIPAATAATGNGRPRITYAQFLRMDGDDWHHVEWVDGEVVPMAPVSNEHSDVQGFLHAILRIFADAHPIGQVRSEPFQMKTGTGLPGRSPDVLFVAKRNLHRLKKNHLQGPADLVIEIISPGSQSTDRGSKFYEYEKGGVLEYWLIDPIRCRAEFYVRGKGGAFQLAPVNGSIYRSKAMKGLWIEVEWLWEKPLPSTLDIQRAWKLF